MDPVDAPLYEGMATDPSTAPVDEFSTVNLEDAAESAYTVEPSELTATAITFTPGSICEVTAPVAVETVDIPFVLAE